MDTDLEKNSTNKLVYGECEIPTSPSQILYNVSISTSLPLPLSSFSLILILFRDIKCAPEPALTEHGTYFDYSQKPTSPSTPYLQPPAPKNTPATPYAKTDYLKTDNFYTRYNHVAERVQNGWEEGRKDLEAGTVSEVVPYLSDILF